MKPIALSRRAPFAVTAMIAIFVCADAVPAQLPPNSNEVQLRVVDAKGGPIQDLSIRVCTWIAGGRRCRLLPGQPQRPLQAKDFGGDYARLRDLPDGELVLIAESVGHALTVSEPFTLPAKAPVRLTLRMQRGITLRGTVTTPEGTPVAGAVVRTLALATDNQHAFAQMVAQMVFVPVTTTSTRTDDDGNFRIENVATGDYVVRATHPDWADARREVMVKGKGEKKLAALELVPGGVIAGAVQRDGQRLSDIVVVLQSEEKPQKGGIPFQAVRVEVRTDAQGRFVLPRVPFGTYELFAHEGGDLIAQAQQAGASKRSIEVKALPGGSPQHELILLPAH